MWSGAVVPPGWAICDGQNGTPDLHDQFVVASGNKHPLGSFGGNDSHSHGPGSYSSQGHAHTINRNQGRVNINTEGLLAVTLLDKYGETVPSDTITTSTSGGDAITGQSTTEPNLPPFYALAFIMKL